MLLLFLSILPLIQNTLSQPTRFPTPAPIFEPTAFPTAQPIQLCCNCITPTPFIAGCPSDQECEDTICPIDPLCCDISWDTQCAASAESICFATDTPTTNPTLPPTIGLPLCCSCIQATPGISGCITDQTCESVVCQSDLYCCNVEWDGICASDANNICNNQTSTPSLSPTTAKPTTTIPTPSVPTVETPTISPTNAPTFNVTINTTILPTESPTNSPTFQPIDNITISPSIVPTLEPTDNTTISPSNAPAFIPNPEPTDFPTNDPTKRPTINPTVNPSIAPFQNITTLDPSALPTREPTLLPTEDITNITTFDPTIIPTNEPSVYPSYVPSEMPSDIPSKWPTFWPTKRPQFDCKDCYKYWVKLVNIEQEDDSMDTTDCNDNNMDGTHWNHWSHSMGDKHKTNKRKKNKGKRRKKHRRRRLKEEGNGYWHNDNKDDNRNYDKCTMNGWGQRRRLIDDDKDCNYNAVGKTGEHHWANSNDDVDDEEVLNEICLIYKVNKYDECGELNAVFLPLCENNDTHYNSSKITADDLDGIISRIYPDSLSANGVKLYDELGINVEFTEFVDKFALCLSNVTVDDNYYANNFDKITMSNWVVFEINDEYEGCTNNDGLPCFNFVFNKKCEKQCKCKDGMKSMTTKYVGDNIAKSVIFYYGDDELCVFLNVETNQEIMCSVESSTHSKLKSDTEFNVFYDDGSECKGSFDTSCSKDIYGQFGDGECQKLQVIGWEDINGNICDQNVFKNNN